MDGSGPGDERAILSGRGEAALTVRRSRFLAVAAPVGDTAALAALLAEVRAAHREARHIPHAWIDGDGSGRSSDDGEPGGTAGRPCLAALARPGLRAAAVAVARIFGGTLLGAANLTRAYGDAATAAVEAAGLRPVTLHRWFELEVDFGAQDRAERALAAAGGHVEERAYGGDVRLAGWVPEASLLGLRDLVGSLPGARWREGAAVWREAR
jgi:putative IMPACT (imprinted ancient) family translation regulator